MHFKHKWELKDWEYDIASFERWKYLYVLYNSEYAMRKMIQIRNRWPNHQKVMELPGKE